MSDGRLMVRSLPVELTERNRVFPANPSHPVHSAEKNVVVES